MPVKIREDNRFKISSTQRTLEVVQTCKPIEEKQLQRVAVDIVLEGITLPHIVLDQLTFMKPREKLSGRGLEVRLPQHWVPRLDLIPRDSGCG